MHRYKRIKLFHFVFHSQFLCKIEPFHALAVVIDVLKIHLTEEGVISRHFPHPWPPRFPDLNPYDFWLWENLKHLASRDNPRTIPDLKDSISQHVQNISWNILLSAVEHAILQFQIVANNNGRLIEYVLL